MKTARNTESPFKRGGMRAGGAALAAAFAAASCMPLTEAAGRLLDGSARAEKTLTAARLSSGAEYALVRGKNGAAAVRVTPDFLPGLRLYGAPPDENGRVGFSRAVFLSGSYDGWNEVVFDAGGAALCETGADGKVSALRFEGPLGLIGLSGGGIRRGATRLSGEPALVELRRRDERISALVEWMAGPHLFKDEEAAALEGAAYFSGPRAFEEFWKPRLLPEMERAKTRNALWRETAAEGRRVFKEDIYWNAAYTERLFPEYMRPLRDGGALLRDWEEAADWIYLKYIWKSLPEML